MASGLCSLVKIVGLMKTGIIPRTINTEPVDTTLEGVKDGKIIVSS